MSIVEEPGPTLDPQVVRWTGYGVAVVGAAVAIYGRFYPSLAATLAALAAPLVTLAILLYAPQLFQITARGRRTTNVLLIAPVVGLLILAFQHDLIDFIWPLSWAAGGAVVGLGLCLYAGRVHQVAGLFSLALFGALFGAGYASGVLVAVDLQFDRSPGQPFTVEMIGKHENHGKSTSYYLDLPPWGPRTGPNSVEASWSTYQTAQTGDPICILLHPGALNGAWFTAQLCQVAPLPLPASPPDTPPAPPTEPTAS